MSILLLFCKDRGEGQVGGVRVLNIHVFESEITAICAGAVVFAIRQLAVERRFRDSRRRRILAHQRQICDSGKHVGDGIQNPPRIVHTPGKDQMPHQNPARCQSRVIQRQVANLPIHFENGVARDGEVILSAGEALAQYR